VPREVAIALVDELRRKKPTILVVEDIHWADEATLDVLRLLGRRIDQVPALVLVTYRDDELTRGHPLRVVLGNLQASEGIARLKLAPLSAAAVAQLAEPYGINALELHHKTGGNPFFIAEVLAAGRNQIPDTIRDAVLARVARLSHGAQALAEALQAGECARGHLLVQPAVRADAGGEAHHLAQPVDDHELAVRIAGDDEMEAVGTQIDSRQHVGHGAGGSTHAGFRPW